MVSIGTRSFQWRLHDKNLNVSKYYELLHLNGILLILENSSLFTFKTLMLIKA